MQNEYYLEQPLLPSVQLQVGGTCVFHAIAYGAETQYRRYCWEKGAPSDVRFRGHSLSTDYIRHMLVRIGYDRIDRIDTAMRLSRDQGIFAPSHEWSGRRRFPISRYVRRRFDDYRDIFGIIRSGYPVLGVFPVRADFRDLGGRIYEMTIPISRENPALSDHMVMFIGVGMDYGRPYLLFLNSHGTRFGTNGIGRIFLDQVYPDQFYTLEVDENGLMIATASCSGGPTPPPGGPPPSGSAGGAAPQHDGNSPAKRQRLCSKG